LLHTREGKINKKNRIIPLLPTFSFSELWSKSYYPLSNNYSEIIRKLYTHKWWQKQKNSEYSPGLRFRSFHLADIQWFLAAWSTVCPLHPQEQDLESTSHWTCCWCCGMWGSTHMDWGTISQELILLKSQYQ